MTTYCKGCGVELDPPEEYPEGLHTDECATRWEYVALRELEGATRAVFKLTDDLRNGRGGITTLPYLEAAERGMRRALREIDEAREARQDLLKPRALFTEWQCDACAHVNEKRATNCGDCGAAKAPRAPG